MESDGYCVLCSRILEHVRTVSVQALHLKREANQKKNTSHTNSRSESQPEGPGRVEIEGTGAEKTICKSYRRNYGLLFAFP